MKRRQALILACALSANPPEPFAAQIKSGFELCQPVVDSRKLKLD